MSRAIFEAPTIVPLPSRIGAMVNETSIDSPDFFLRTVSRCSIRSPALSRFRISTSWSCSSDGMMIVIGCPRASSSVQPNIRSAERFQLLMIPSRLFEIIASSEESTTAASRNGEALSVRRGGTRTRKPSRKHTQHLQGRHYSIHCRQVGHEQYKRLLS